MKHILITGAQGVGKSTLIRRILACYPTVTPRGFLTKKEEPDETGLCHCYIHPASEKIWKFGPENQIGTCRERSGGANPIAFETVGLALLQDIPPKSLILMDELGFFESNAPLFQAQVIRCLDSLNSLVIAAVKDKPTDFLDRVLAHPNGRVFQLDENNRESVFTSILEEISTAVTFFVPSVS